MTKNTPPPPDNRHVMVSITDPQSELSHTADSGVDQGGSTVSLADILDCSDEDDDITDDITDVTSGVFADEGSELNASPAFKSLQKQVGTPDSMDSMDLPSAVGSCEGLSPASSHPSSSPKAMDSGYDTENNESPEFVPKESHDTRSQAQGKPTLDASLEEVEESHEEEDKAAASEDQPLSGQDLFLENSQMEDHLLPLSDKSPYRDSAYFSDYENEKQNRDEESELLLTETSHRNDGEKQQVEGKKAEKRKSGEEEELKDVVVNKDMKLEVEQDPKDQAESPPPETSSTEEHSQDKESLDSPITAEGILDKWPLHEESSALGDWAAEVVGAMEEALGALNGDCASSLKEGKEMDDIKDSSEACKMEETKMKTIYKRASGEIPHILPKDEVALQHTDRKSVV